MEEKNCKHQETVPLSLFALYYTTATLCWFIHGSEILPAVPQRYGNLWRDLRHSQEQPRNPPFFPSNVM